MLFRVSDVSALVTPRRDEIVVLDGAFNFEVTDPLCSDESGENSPADVMDKRCVLSHDFPYRWRAVVPAGLTSFSFVLFRERGTPFFSILSLNLWN